MTNQLQGKYTRGFGLSLVIIMIINGLLVIIKESSSGLMNSMKGTLGHHWTTHGVLLTILFIVLGLIFSHMNSEATWWSDAKKLSTAIVVASALGVVLICGFFLVA
ncbi:MAG: hypothetical protein ACYC6G_18680 [Desulfobaccales bacterium]